jgi:hypothetical protein
MNNTHEAALFYAGLGYPVFPCRINDKRPATDHGCHDATTDVEQINRWWTANPDLNVAIATDGLVVVDIDGADNQWPGEEHSMELASVPTAKTPSGGSHRYFRQPDGKSYKNSVKKLADDVDTRSNGGYVLAPPSQIDGSSYAWVDGCELDAGPEDLKEAPSWICDKLDEADSKTKTLQVEVKEQPIPQGQRDHTLFKMACAHRRIGHTEKEIFASLMVVNADRCQPPMDVWDIERIARQAAKFTPDQIATAIVEGHFEQLQTATVENEIEEDESVLDDPGPLPANLMSVPGFVDDLMEYTLQTALYPDRSLAMVGALAMMAFLCSRKVMDSIGTRANIYLLGLASSGVGKDHPRKVNAKVLNHINMLSCLGDSFASGEGLEDAVMRNPVLLYQVDEIDNMMASIASSRDGRSESLVANLLKLFSSSNGVVSGRAKSQKESLVCHQPHLNLIGSAIPKHFYDSLNEKMLTKGLLARMLVFESGKRAKFRASPPQELPESIRKAAEFWSTYSGAGGNCSQMSSTVEPKPAVVPSSPCAEKARLNAIEQIDSMFRKCEEANDEGGKAMWNRALEKINKLALLAACSASHESPQITWPMVTWATKVVIHQTRKMLFACEKFGGSSSLAASRIDKVLTVIGKLESDGKEPARWLVLRRSKLLKKDFDDVIETLLHQRRIVSDVKPSLGRHGTIYKSGTKTGAISSEIETEEVQEVEVQEAE